MDKFTQYLYLCMLKVFTDHCENSLYDVDMFTHDVCKTLFTETDPQDIDEDGFMYFQEALILLVRDDLLLNYYGLSGLSVIHAELMNHAEHYYVFKVIFKED
ncbi:MAG: hypothetical protein J6Y02_03905 [Pseudobutyrivibrio sp.]|nr:hypothetical protein [Pseudobutyrivibrio sp.]